MKKKILTLLLTLCLATSLCACQKAEENNEVQEENVAVEDEVMEQESVDADTEESQEIKAETSEEENTENAVAENTPEVWFESLNLTEPTVAIWDMDTCTGIIVENEKEYEFGDNNKLLLYYAVPITEFYTSEGIIAGEMFPTYMEFETDFETGIGVILKEVSGETTYKQDFKLTRAKQDTTETESNSAGSMEVWLDNIALEEPSVVIWDEETLSGTYVEDGGSYEIDEYNKFFIYIPLGMGINNITSHAIYKVEVGEIVSYTCIELIVPLEKENPCEIGVVVSDGTTYTQEFTLFMAQ